jgi:uncharacterized RDD family membrane protein YckC
MSDPNQPTRPEGSSDDSSGEAPAPPPPPSGYEGPTPPASPPPSGDDPYGAAAAAGGGYGQPDYGQQPGYGQPAGEPSYAPGVEQPGRLLDRFLARLIDGVLLGVVVAIIDAVLLAGILGLSAGSGLGVGGSYAYAAIAAVIGTAINLGYFGYLESTRGQTVGKMALKLHVKTMSGGLPTFEQAVRRNIWLALPLLGIVPVLGGIVGGLAELAAVIMIAVGISNDPVTRRPWTDKYAETRVVKVPR